MASDYSGAVNIGNDYTVSVDELATMLMEIADYPVTLKHVDGIQGVRGRNSDNSLSSQSSARTGSRKYRSAKG
jgi:GDP-D-mannose 3',5'-epimerase